ncbi:acyltransferase family protein [Marinicella sp. S1101]|uniref:acyltransferase family protein n=1 Tax=Marinicella marina TaxID=2996016 RepID=UPI0022609EEB|nr:acyltransferase family protein [Marinicella marina]MCX7553134.1 acyltransferase family protein [Marinicella marina]MDJ1138866.1 acyltransferase family protein [Marinicella marina]
MNNEQALLTRRYDLDWLRVLVFGLLIFYHVGMLYVADWGYHYKSNYQSESLQSLMIFLNQWRLPLLFLISGIAIRFFLNKVSLVRFIGLRTLRLWVPLLFGIWVVVPPQLYVEMMAKGDLPAISYHEFYLAFFDLSHPYFENYPSGIFPHVDVNHLWYIRELWYFSIYLLLAYGLLSVVRLMPYLYAPFRNWSITVLFVVLVLVMSLLQLLVFPEGSEGTRKALGFSFLCWGFLMGWEYNLWQQLSQHRRRFLAIAVVSFMVLITYYHLYYTSSEPAQGLAYLLERLVVFTNRWAWIFAILGYAHHHLNRPHRWLRYLNEAVYPYYILHQTFIIVLAYVLSAYQLGPIIEPILVIVLTFLLCGLGFEIIRRSAVLRLLFGLKIEQPIKTKKELTPKMPN